MTSHFNEKYPTAFKKRLVNYFKKHTARECAEKFDLTHGQVIGVLEMARRKGLMAPNFKDTRNKEPWTLKDWLYMIQRCGLRPRSFIGTKLGRGGARVIKERLKVVNSGSKFLNGMPRTWAVELWGQDIPEGFKTDAGPTGGPMRSDFHFIVIPWPVCERLSLERKTPANISAGIRAMAKFQLWIHGLSTSKGINRRVRAILNER